VYSRNKSQEEIPCGTTVIWSCTSEGCTCWMRDNFAFEAAPTCWKCHAPMASSEKSLPLLINNSHYYKEKES
jgi:hypothetical protein